MTITAKAQKKTKAGGGRPRFSLSVADREWGGRISGLDVAYIGGEESPNGTSEATFEAESGVQQNLSLLTDAPVRVEIGYGDEAVEWFRGKLEFTEEGDPVAWGPFKLMAEQRFGEEVSYLGWDLDAALLDIADRAGMRGVEVQGGSGFSLGKKARFPRQAFFGAAISRLLKSADFVGPDRPGNKKVFMPRPRPGASAKHRASYDEGHYPPEGFTVSRSRRGYFAAVEISSKLPDGSDAFTPVLVPVAARGRFRPPANRIYSIYNFHGDSAEALETAISLAEKLERGTTPYTLSGIGANPDLLLYDPIECKGTEEVDAGGKKPERHRVTYDCQIDEELRAILSREGNLMSQAGTAVEVSRRVLPKPFYVSRRRSPVVTREKRTWLSPGNWNERRWAD